MNLPPARGSQVAGFDLHYPPDEIESVTAGLRAILESGFISMGRNVAEFEKRWAEFCGVKYAVGTANGTCALEVILRSIDVKGKTVALPSHTFIATAAAAIHAGARVIFIDCQRENLQMDPEDLSRKLRPDTKAVILVHMSGIISPHLERIKKICAENGSVLVEDAAHAHGATIHDRKAGSLGLAGSFSFFSTKVITTGEGGMITTDDETIYKNALALRDHGRFGREPNLHDDIGSNWRPSELNAVLGLAQMTRASAILQRRRDIAAKYDRELRVRHLPSVELLEIPHHIRSSYYKYVLYVLPPLQRDRIMRELREDHQVSLGGLLYNRPCHSQPLFQRHPETVVSDPRAPFPETDFVVSHHLCLPLYFDLKDEQVDRVIDAFQAVVSRHLA
ncbi:MAG TPA: DegT/DnrJ/EryC1/StrS family aminotransferase [Chthoniobacterales bacterium]|jgi:dTDP-4-amino-4,6-dideoxygalactose transaminase